MKIALVGYPLGRILDRHFLVNLVVLTITFCSYWKLIFVKCKSSIDFFLQRHLYSKNRTDLSRFWQEVWEKFNILRVGSRTFSAPQFFAGIGRRKIAKKNEKLGVSVLLR